MRISHIYLDYFYRCFCLFELWKLPKKYKNRRNLCQIQLSKILKKKIELEKFEGPNRAGKVFPFETDYSRACQVLSSRNILGSSPPLAIVIPVDSALIQGRRNYSPRPRCSHPNKWRMFVFMGGSPDALTQYYLGRSEKHVWPPPLAAVPFGRTYFGCMSFWNFSLGDFIRQSANTSADNPINPTICSVSKHFEYFRGHLPVPWAHNCRFRLVVGDSPPETKNFLLPVAIPE